MKAGGLQWPLTRLLWRMCNSRSDSQLKVNRQNCGLMQTVVIMYYIRGGVEAIVSPFDVLTFFCQTTGRC